MSNVLCFTLRFLDPLPRFHGLGNGGVPEWPPSPLRLFQAIVDAAANRWRGHEFDDQARPALLWLERLATPTIIAPPRHLGVPLRIAVPNNDLDVWAKPLSKGMAPKKQPNELKTMKTVHPAYIIGAHALHYHFALADGACPYFDVLQLAAQSVTHLGWGVDMVAGDAAVLPNDEAAKVPGERWLPAVGFSNNELRIPQAGTLHDLARKHDDFVNRLAGGGLKPVRPLTAFRMVAYRRETEALPRPFAAFRLLDPDTGKPQSFPGWRAVTVAGMIRGAAHEVAKNADRDPNWIGEFVCGHHQGPDSFPRFSYLPLPSIQPVVGVGRISRVLIAEPIGSDGQEIAWLKRLLTGQTAKSEQGRDALLVPLTGDNVLNQYVGTSRSWTTVTPVALPGSDDGMATKTTKLLEKMFRHAGYSSDSVEDIQYHRVPFLRGAEDAKRYRPGGGHYLSNSTMYHMRIRWKHRMRGPIALGAGRHCGLGVFAALDD